MLVISSICNSQNSAIHDIWIGDYQKTLYYDSSESLYQHLPYLIDFTDSNKAIINYFAEGKNNVNWSLNDSILNIGDENYRIIDISDDSLVISSYLEVTEKPKKQAMEHGGVKVEPVKDKHQVFRRLKKHKIGLSKDQMTDILSNSLYVSTSRIIDALNNGDWIEFLDNGVAIFKMHIDNKSFDIHLQEECWKIEDYEGYSFLVFYRNWPQGNGMYNRGYQILGFSENRFKLSNYPNYKNSEYKKVSTQKDNSSNITMTGEWISFNDSSKFKSSHYPSMLLKNPQYRIYNDTLKYTFQKDSMFINVKGIPLISCNWRISSDSTLLIYEYQTDNEEFKGYHVEYSLLRNLNNNSFEIYKFNNSIKTTLEKPKVILLNSRLRFEKVK